MAVTRAEIVERVAARLKLAGAPTVDPAVDQCVDAALVYVTRTYLALDPTVVPDPVAWDAPDELVATGVELLAVRIHEADPSPSGAIAALGDFVAEGAHTVEDLARHVHHYWDHVDGQRWGIA